MTSLKGVVTVRVSSLSRSSSLNYNVFIETEKIKNEEKFFLFDQFIGRVI